MRKLFLIIFVLIGLMIFVGGYGIKLLREVSVEDQEFIDITLPINPEQSEEAAARYMLNSYLEHFTKREHISVITNYKIESLELVSTSEDSFIFTASFAVQPPVNPEKSNWLKNTSGRLDGSWIREIKGRFLVGKHNNLYRLRPFY